MFVLVWFSLVWFGFGLFVVVFVVVVVVVVVVVWFGLVWYGLIFVCFVLFRVSVGVSEGRNNKVLTYDVRNGVSAQFRLKLKMAS